MSRSSTPDVNSTAKTFAQSRPNARRLNERLAWFVAAYVLVATFVTAVAGDLRGDPPTSPQPSIVSTSSTSLQASQPDARDAHNAPV